MIETPNWNKDRFGVPLEQGSDYFRLRTNTRYSPIEGETLGGYCRRMANAIKQQEDINLTAHTGGRKVWFTHRTPSECWICQDINIMWYLYETMNMIPNQEDYVFKSKDNKIVLEQIERGQ